MRKYWKFTAIITVIVLSIGAFYVNSALSATQYPEFVIKKQSGNAEEIKSLVLEGGYHEGIVMSYTNTHLKLTSDGSEYRNGNSFIDQIIGQPAPIIKDLQNKYRDFMRGKGEDLVSFFENDKFLAYANVNYKFGVSESSDFKFDISILDKNNGNTTSYNIKVPDSSAVDYIYVEDVQVVDNELKMITHNTLRKNESYFNEKHIYTLDISTGTITNNEVIFSVPEAQGNSHVNARLINTIPIQASENLVFSTTQSNFEEGTDGLRESSSSTELISYSLKTQEKETIDLPEGLKDSQDSFFDGLTIYFTEIREQSLIVTPYSIENNQAGSELTIQLSDAISNEGPPPIIIVKENKLYAVSSISDNRSNATVAVVNVETGETLYEGEVVRKNTTESIEEFELYIYEMSVN